MGSTLYQVKVTAHARKNELSFESDHRIRIKTTVPPERGKANDKIIEMIAKELKIPQKKITIKSGEFSKNKIISIED